MKEGVRWSLYFSCMIFSFIVLLILIFVIGELINFFSEPLSGGYGRGYGIGIIGFYLILPLTFIVSGILYAIITKLNLTSTTNVNVGLILRTVVYIILGIICLWLFLITFLNN